MKASKEQCAKAQRMVTQMQEHLSDEMDKSMASGKPFSPALNYLMSRLKIVQEFLEVAERKLPQEASFPKPKRTHKSQVEW